MADAKPVAGKPDTKAGQTTPEPKLSTGQVGTPEVIDAQEHVLGDDPRRNEAATEGFHDSLSGRAVNSNGDFVEGAEGEGPIPKHRIVANNWVELREDINDPAKREGNEQAQHNNR